MSSKFIYILYKTERIETEEFYIGIHRIDTDKCPDFNDGYLGSGKRLKASVKKIRKKWIQKNNLKYFRRF